MTPEEHLAGLWRKVDGFFDRVAARYPGALTCGPGCADCCRRQLTVTGVEAARITAAVALLPPEARAALATAVSAPVTEACVALDDAGRCSIYEARPVVCRSHGLPLRFTEPAAEGRRALPMLDVCPLNFGGRDLATVDADCVLDQQTLSVLLGAIDALHAKEAGADPARRPLRDILREALRAA